MATTTKLKTKLRPLHDRVLIKRLEEQDEKHGSIIIPDSAKEKPQEGKVIAVGTGKVTDDGKTLPLAVKADGEATDVRPGGAGGALAGCQHHGRGREGDTRPEGSERGH